MDMKTLNKTNVVRAIMSMVRDHGFSQKEIAERAGVSTSCIHNMLNGGSPRLTTMAKVYRLAEDLGEVKADPTPPPNTSKNMEVFRGVGDDGREFQIILIRE